MYDISTKDLINKPPDEIVKEFEQEVMKIELMR